MADKPTNGKMAGGVGFEPTHAGAKDPCLTDLANPQQFSLLYTPAQVKSAIVVSVSDSLAMGSIWTERNEV